MARSFIDHINRGEAGDAGEAALENQHDDDCRGLLLFQKYNISYPKHLEDEEIHATRINQETREYLECYPSSLFYDETSLHPGLTNSYGLDSKITEHSPVTTAVETKKLPHESDLPCPLRFESKLNKPNTANRKKCS